MESWREIFDREEISEELRRIETLVGKGSVCPQRKDWFRWAELTQLDKVRVVIIGQDPYHTGGVADGLAFSSKKPSYLPPSLRNIFKCLEKQGLLSPSTQRRTSLDSWAKQGVLLLNTAFSVELGKPKSHSEFWRTYFDLVFAEIVARLTKEGMPPLPVFAWGNDAKNAVHRALSEELKKRIHLMTFCHPSPLNGDRFLACPHFSDLNRLLTSLKLSPVAWDSVEQRQVDEKEPECEKAVIFTDGSAYNGMAGSAALFVSGCVLAGKAILVNGRGTNIVAEGTAILSALRAVQRDASAAELVEIYTDSDFWIKMIEQYMPNWSREQFEKNANSKLTAAVHAEVQRTKEKKRLRFIHVPSHGKKGTREKKPFEYEWNKKADELATFSREQLSLEEVKLVPFV